MNEHILFVNPSSGCLSTCAQLLTSMGESGVDPRCGFWGHGGSLILFNLCPKDLGMSERAYFICGTKQRLLIHLCPVGDIQHMGVNSFKLSVVA